MRSEVWKEDKEREEKKENGEESDPSEVGEPWVSLFQPYHHRESDEYGGTHTARVDKFIILLDIESG